MPNYNKGFEIKSQVFFCENSKFFFDKRKKITTFFVKIFSCNFFKILPYPFGRRKMLINAQYQNNVLYIKLSGEIDEHSAGAARREADRLADGYVGAKSAVFDLSGISFMDSTGIGFLIGRYKKFQRCGVICYITAPTQSTDKILSMSGIYTLMPKI